MREYWYQVQFLHRNVFEFSFFFALSIPIMLTIIELLFYSYSLLFEATRIHTSLCLPGRSTWHGNRDQELGNHRHQRIPVGSGGGDHRRTADNHHRWIGRQCDQGSKGQDGSLHRGTRICLSNQKGGGQPQSQRHQEARGLPRPPHAHQHVG